MQPNRILTRALIFFALFFFSNQIVIAQLSELDKRCLWVVRESLYNKEMIDSALIYAYQAGYKTVFIQVRGRG